MLSAEFRAAVENALALCHPGPFDWRPAGRGVDGDTWRVQAADAAGFLKIADEPQRLVMEADGLQALAGCGAVRVPQVLATGEAGGTGFLLMEWLELGRKTPPAAARLGEALAQQHQRLGERFGWYRNNFIGATPQFNASAEDWVQFFRDHRLGFQLRLAAENGYRGDLQERGALLLQKLPVFFGSYRPQPSLLHGDLWRGNWGVLQSGEPVIFDPAVHYGDREADLAMTELFGGFPQEFYSAYTATWPLDSGYQKRRDLYNLYHLLNHLNLFGTGYLAQATAMLTRLLSLVE